MSIAEKLVTIAENEQRVFEAGTKALWDGVLNKGARTNVEYLFNRWNCEYIRPPYVIKASTRPIYCFQINTKLKKIEKQYFDFSGCPLNPTSDTSGNYYVCYYCTNLEVFEDIGLPPSMYTNTWGSCLKLHTIELVRSQKTTKYSSAFNQCSELVNIRFEGEIGQNISFGTCGKLSVESVVDILQHLADLTGGTAMTITLHDNVKTLMANQGAMAELDGMTYDAYISSKGWTLA